MITVYLAQYQYDPDDVKKVVVVVNLDAVVDVILSNQYDVEEEDDVHDSIHVDDVDVRLVLDDESDDVNDVDVLMMDHRQTFDDDDDDDDDENEELKLQLDDVVHCYYFR